jgi:hypothetical protein
MNRKLLMDIPVLGGITHSDKKKIKVIITP